MLENKYCHVALVPFGGTIRFQVDCYDKGVLKYTGVVLQDRLGVVIRRWTYVNVYPFGN